MHTQIEELVYHLLYKLHQHEFPALGITTTLLPSSLFIIKKGEDKVQLARSAQDALKEVAVPLDLTHVGIGTSHSFTSKNANTRVLVAIDNYLQSPIAGTSVTTTLDRRIDKSQDVIFFTGITSFFGADNIRVSSGNTSEVMKIYLLVLEQLMVLK